MPAKKQVPKERILTAALELLKTQGYEAVNIKQLSAALGCSTQPIYLSFSGMDELRMELTPLTVTEFEKYMSGEAGNAVRLYDLRYIQFSKDEPHLFRFLFQSDYFNGKTLLELIDAEELTPVLSAMQRSLGIGMEQTKTVFVTVFLFAHGYASIIANNEIR